jgi:hypothetical protein
VHNKGENWKNPKNGGCPEIPYESHHIHFMISRMRRRIQKLIKPNKNQRCNYGIHNTIIKSRNN